MAVAMALLVFAARQLLLWIKRAPRRPDPWDAETEAAVQQPDAVPVCHRCLTPAPPGQWFCPHCGCAVGPYNNLMPYVCVFSEGEVLRNGVTDRLPCRALTIVGYLLLSLPLYLIFAPVYWVFLFRNLLRQPSASASLNESRPG